MKLLSNKNTKKQAKQRQNLLKIFIVTNCAVTWICAVMVAAYLASQSMQNLQICVFILIKQMQCAIIVEFYKKGK